MHVILVEDDARVSKFLSESLQGSGYTVDVCTSVEEAIACMAIATTTADIVILDRLLQGEDGITLISAFRTRFPDCKIVMLSAVNFADEKAAALDRGADDYLAKPFSYNELAARLRAVSRRGKQTKTGVLLQCKDVIIDLRSQQISVGGKRLELAKKEFQLLCTLVEEPGRVYNRYQLLDRVWEVQADIESNVVEVTINNLRKKLKDSASQLEILSKRNVGYWVEA